MKRIVEKKILIMGGGYVGLTVSVALASFCNSIIVFDKDADKISLLKDGKIPLYEPDLIAMYNNVRRNMVFTDDVARGIKESEIIFITVGTELINGRLNLANFDIAVKLLKKYLEPGKIVVIKSTVPVGTADKVNLEMKKKFGNGVSVGVNPEFLREGHALSDFLHPQRIVIGSEDENTTYALLELYSPIDAPKLVVDFRTAEMIKYVSNAFLSTKISFVNEVANICGYFDVDINEVVNAVGLDKRIGRDFFEAGIGFGGSCLPKDLLTFIKIAEKAGYKPKLLKAVKEVNDNQVELFVEKIASALGLSNKTVAAWGLSFKGGTNDVRDSPAIKAINRLLSLGYTINAYDPEAIDNARKVLGSSVRFFNDPISAAVNAEALIVLSNWQEFLSVNLCEVLRVMKNKYFFDGRNFFDPKVVEGCGFLYYGIGRKNAT
jgi:UDPglucose 6-dehydrogenase